VKFVKPYIQPLKTALKNAEGGEMKMKPGEPVKRPCYKTDGKVCIIDVCMFLFFFKYVLEDKIINWKLESFKRSFSYVI